MCGVNDRIDAESLLQCPCIANDKEIYSTTMSCLDKENIKMRDTTLLEILWSNRKAHITCNFLSDTRPCLPEQVCGVCEYIIHIMLDTPPMQCIYEGMREVVFVMTCMVYHVVRVTGTVLSLNTYTVFDYTGDLTVV